MRDGGGRPAAARARATASARRCWRSRSQPPGSREPGPKIHARDLRRIAASCRLFFPPVYTGGADSSRRARRRDRAAAGRRDPGDRLGQRLDDRRHVVAIGVHDARAVEHDRDMAAPEDEVAAARALHPAQRPAELRPACRNRAGRRGRPSAARAAPAPSSRAPLASGRPRDRACRRSARQPPPSRVPARSAARPAAPRASVSGAMRANSSRVSATAIRGAEGQRAEWSAISATGRA